MSASSLAHMTRLFAIADEFKSRGNNVLFTSSEDRVDFIENAGFEVFHELYPPINFNDEYDQTLNYINTNREHFKRWFSVEIQAANEFKPNVVVTSPGFLGPHVTFKTGIPTVAILNAPYLPESVGLLGISLTNNNPYNLIFRKLLKPIFAKGFTKLYLNEVLSIYKDLEIEFLGGSHQELYKNMDIIIPSIYELEPVHSLNRYFYSGPLFWQGFSKDFPIDKIGIKNRAKERKIIYLSFGGSVFNLDFYKRILNMVGKLPYYFIVSTGMNINRKEIEYNSNNTEMYRFIDGLGACEVADLVINTGSHGTVMQALKYGKPLICVPCNIDQSYFAYRVEEMGVGLNINKTNILKFTKRESYYKLDVSINRKMEDSIKKILSEKSFYQAAQRISRLINIKGDASKIICDYIERTYAI